MPRTEPHLDVLVVGPAHDDVLVADLAFGMRALWLEQLEERGLSADSSGNLEERSPAICIVETDLIPVGSSDFTLRVRISKASRGDRSLVVERCEITTSDPAKLVTLVALVPALAHAHVRGLPVPAAVDDLVSTFGTAIPQAAFAVIKSMGHYRRALRQHLVTDPYPAIESLVDVLRHDPKCARASELGEAFIHRLCQARDTDAIMARNFARRLVSLMGTTPPSWLRWVEDLEWRTEDGARALVDRVFSRDGEGGRVPLADFLAIASVVRTLAALGGQDEILLRVDVPELDLLGGIALAFGGHDGDGGLYVFDSVDDHRLWLVEEDENTAAYRDVGWREDPEDEPVVRAMADLSGIAFTDGYPHLMRCPPYITWPTARDVAILHAVLQALAVVLPEARGDLLTTYGDPSVYSVKTGAGGRPVTVTLVARATELTRLS